MNGCIWKLRSCCTTAILFFFLLPVSAQQPGPPPDLADQVGRHGAIDPFFEKENNIGSPYLFNGWMRGSVEFKNHKHLPEPGNFLWFNFDKVYQIVFVLDTLNRIFQYPIDSVLTLYLSDGEQTYNFEKVSWISDHYFLMPVIKSANGYSLYKRMFTKIVPANYSSEGYYTLGKKSDEYDDYYEYYIVYPGNKKYRKIFLRENVIRRVLRHETKLLNEFFARNADEIDEQSLLGIIQYIDDKKYPD